MRKELWSDTALAECYYISSVFPEIAQNLLQKSEISEKICLIIKIGISINAQVRLSVLICFLMKSHNSSFILKAGTEPFLPQNGYVRILVLDIDVIPLLKPLNIVEVQLWYGVYGDTGKGLSYFDGIKQRTARKSDYWKTKLLKH